MWQFCNTDQCICYTTWCPPVPNLPASSICQVYLVRSPHTPALWITITCWNSPNLTRFLSNNAWNMLLEHSAKFPWSSFSLYTRTCGACKSATLSGFLLSSRHVDPGGSRGASIWARQAPYPWLVPVITRKVRRFSRDGAAVPLCPFTMCSGASSSVAIKRKTCNIKTPFLGKCV